METERLTLREQTLDDAAASARMWEKSGAVECLYETLRSDLTAAP
jgi:hypothetical protein